MKKARYTEEKCALALRQAESGTAVAEVVRRMGGTELTFYRWKKKLAIVPPGSFRAYQIGEALEEITPCHRRLPEAGLSSGGEITTRPYRIRHLVARPRALSPDKLT
jgi:transposase-like protein